VTAIFSVRKTKVKRTKKEWLIFLIWALELLVDCDPRGFVPSLECEREHGILWMISTGNIFPEVEQKFHEALARK
jgi:hypothetical protein